MKIYAVGPFELDADRLLLKRNGKPVGVGPKVVETLLALVEIPGTVVLKAALIDRIWPEAFVEEANLTQNIYVLRKLFRSIGEKNPITTVPGCGYRLEVSVREKAAAPADVGRAIARGTPTAGLTRLNEIPWARVVGAIAGAVLAVLVISFAGTYDGARRIEHSGELSNSSERTYQVGHRYWNLRTRDGIEKSVIYFARVIDLDPMNARGYAALADANLALGEYCFGTHQPPVYFVRAREYALEALNLDSRSAEAHAALGFLALHEGDPAAGIEDLQLALAADPRNSEAHEWYGIALLQQGNRDEGRRQLEQATRLEPLAVSAIAWLGALAYQDNRYDVAITYSREALELAPKRVDALRILGEAYEAEGNIPEAVGVFRQYSAADRFYRPDAAALLAEAYARERRIREARAQLIYAQANASSVLATDLTAAAAALGDRNTLARHRTGGHNWQRTVEIAGS